MCPKSLLKFFGHTQGPECEPEKRKLTLSHHPGHWLYLSSPALTAHCSSVLQCTQTLDLEIHPVLQGCPIARQVLGWRVVWNQRLSSEDMCVCVGGGLHLKTIALKLYQLLDPSSVSTLPSALHLYPYCLWNQFARETHGLELLGWDSMSSVAILVSYALPCPCFELLLCFQAWASHLLTPGFPTSCHPHWSLALPFPPGLDSLL